MGTVRYWMECLPVNRRMEAYRPHLEGLYARYNRRAFVEPDPLQFLYDYADVRDREIVGLVASGLAYGRVAQIVRSIAAALDRLTPSPRTFVEGASRVELRRALAGFKHRFTTDEEVVALLAGIQRVLRYHESLGACFQAGLDEDAPDVRPAMTAFVAALSGGREGPFNSLLACPSKGSACKRLNLYLRWMVRRDEVDPGGWDGVSPAKLIVPLDTHMFALARAMGLTRRNQADMIAAVEISAAFRRLCPDDPVRYDFALTRLGIRTDTDLPGFLDALRETSGVRL